LLTWLEMVPTRRFEAEALFKADGTKSSIATALESLG
jgi:hypothetical protein